MKKGICNFMLCFIIFVSSSLLSSNTSIFAEENLELGLNKISVGTQHFLILGRDHSVWSAGLNDRGQTGRPNIGVMSDLGAVPSVTNAVDIAVGEFHSLVLTADGVILQWPEASNLPTKITSLTDVIAIQAGRDFNVALTKDGFVWTWGVNDRGQLGTGDTKSRTEPIQVPNLKDVVEIAVKGDTTVVLKKDGTVWGWGSNPFYRIGEGDSDVPTQLKIPVKVKHIYIGASYAAVIDDQSNVWTWGANSVGQLGDGTKVSKSVPTKIDTLKSVKQLALGNSFGLALKENGTVVAWGGSIYGIVPKQIESLSGISSIAAGGSTSMAVSNSSHIYTWGRLMGSKGGTATVPVEVTIDDLPKQVKPLEAPKSLQIKMLSNTSAKLSWSSPLTGNENSTGYNIYQNNVLVGTTTETNYVINALNSKIEYTFMVRARDSAGNESDSSNLVKKKASKQYTYVYNTTGRLISIIYESGKKIVYTYDKNGNLTKTTIVNP
ncbi:fibronectin type III domain-containing protein [Paenibacillus sp. AK121]|uniref:RCC1 domain-containing protein n=1 Tax=Paenibacillus TaxID=44249 RepID=UPI001C248635|nr:fibronectin type III domain-containing protein [Paenibacillus sp. AK121]MBU9709166.1 fibronectin type III domain-containing protein [Paenibacillus sp. AK121]MEE4566538.1 fibronectin type III domain-containing protein [Paenibacillus polymyxa]